MLTTTLQRYREIRLRAVVFHRDDDAEGEMQTAAQSNQITQDVLC